MLQRVEELKGNLSTEYATLLGVGNDSSEEKNNQYFVNKGYSYETSLFAMRRDLAQSIQLQELAASYDCQLWTMDEEGDLEEYMKADSEIWPDASIDLLRLLQLRQRDIWTAIAIRDNGTLVGSVMAWTEDEPSDGIIEDVFVRERWRKQGIAKHLLFQALIYLKSLGCTTAELQVEVRNQAALALYYSEDLKRRRRKKIRHRDVEKDIKGERVGIELNEQQYRDFYDRVGSLNGWNFSKLQCRVEGHAANLYEEVLSVCKRSDLLLDIGTGGGEAILAIHEGALLLVGIDLSSGMIQTAQANLRRSEVSNVRFLQMDAEKLDFPEGFFDIVSCRHSAFNAINWLRYYRKVGYSLPSKSVSGIRII